MQVVSPTSSQYDRKSVNPSYSRLSEAFRHVTAGPLQCQVFCGGKSCKYERSDVWNEDQMAVPGLFSHWVTDNILAMARPNYTEMKKHNMVDSFKKVGVTSVINLQEGGEHASCGNALHSSGFSYDPLEFMDNGIFYYNFNIQDYSVPLQRTLLDICKVVTFAQGEGGVAIHCHAGLGRTGVVIACFLVYFHKMKPKDAILLVRKNRPRSIQTRNQLKAVFRFAIFLAPLWIQFPHHAPQHTKYDVEELVENQKIVLHGLEARTLKYIPKVIYMICSWVLETVGYPTAVLYKKIQTKASCRPFTCPSTYQFEEDEELDSVVGDDEGVLCNVAEVEEMEEMMTPLMQMRRSSSEAVISFGNRDVTSHSQVARIANVSHRLNLSPRCSLKNESLVPEITLPDAGLYREDEIEYAGEETVDAEENCIGGILIKDVSETACTAIAQFIVGVTYLSDELCQDITCDRQLYTTDIDLVISQLNVGIWESFDSLTPTQLGALLRLWFSNLPKPVLSIFEVEMLIRRCDLRVREEGCETSQRYLDKLADAFDTLSGPQIGTVHCLLTTFAMLLYGPFRQKKTDIFPVLEYLLTQNQDGEPSTPKENLEEKSDCKPSRITPILAGLLLSKYREMQRNA